MQTEDKEEGFIGCVFLFEDGNIANTSFLGQVSCITFLRQDRNVYCKGIGMYIYMSLTKWNSGTGDSQGTTSQRKKIIVVEICLFWYIGLSLKYFM